MIVLMLDCVVLLYEAKYNSNVARMLAVHVRECANIIMSILYVLYFYFAFPSNVYVIYDLKQMTVK